MYKIVEFSHLVIKDYINSNNFYIRCVDATCGRGEDTLFISNLLNDNGHIDAFDIQMDAINSTKQKLIDNNITNVDLFNQSFTTINPENYDLFVFNLGYLPGGNKTITTMHEDSLYIIRKIIDYIPLNLNSLLVIAVYPGHEEGKLESDVIDELIKNLDSKIYLVSKYQNYNQNNPPYLVTISNKHKK